MYWSTDWRSAQPAGPGSRVAVQKAQTDRAARPQLRQLIGGVVVTVVDKDDLARDSVERRLQLAQQLGHIGGLVPRRNEDAQPRDGSAPLLVQEYEIVHPFLECRRGSLPNFG
jgi:hypothetical protein